MKNSPPICRVTVVHEEAVRRVRNSMPDEVDLAGLADFFKVLGDATRIKILQALLQAELCVCDLAAILGASQSGISHQLKFLRLSNLVKFRKEGKVVYYSLSDSHVSDILERGFEHVREKS